MQEWRKDVKTLWYLWAETENPRKNKLRRGLPKAGLRPYRRRGAEPTGAQRSLLGFPERVSLQSWASRGAVRTQWSATGGVAVQRRRGLGYRRAAQGLLGKQGSVGNLLATGEWPRGLLRADRWLPRGKRGWGGRRDTAYTGPKLIKALHFKQVRLTDFQLYCNMADKKDSVWGCWLRWQIYKEEEVFYIKGMIMCYLLVGAVLGGGLVWGRGLLGVLAMTYF